MPTYAYACRDCGHDFEAVQSFSDDSLTVCPECGGNLRKVFANVGVVFKGSGFYRNDSRGPDKTATSSSDSGSGSSDKASGGDKGSGDKKPAEPAAAKSSTKGSDKGGSTTATPSKTSSSSSSGSGSGSAA